MLLVLLLPLLWLLLMLLVFLQLLRWSDTSSLSPGVSVAVVTVASNGAVGLSPAVVAASSYAFGHSSAVSMAAANAVGVYIVYLCGFAAAAAVGLSIAKASTVLLLILLVQPILLRLLHWFFLISSQ
jgi:hypothetical protein